MILEVPEGQICTVVSQCGGVIAQLLVLCRGQKGQKRKSHNASQHLFCLQEQQPQPEKDREKKNLVLMTLECKIGLLYTWRHWCSMMFLSSGVWISKEKISVKMKLNHIVERKISADEWGVRLEWWSKAWLCPLGILLFFQAAMLLATSAVSEAELSSWKGALCSAATDIWGLCLTSRRNCCTSAWEVIHL